MKNNLHVAIAFFGIAVSSAAHAHEPHSHGKGYLLADLADTVLTIELRADMGSFVGFERLPATDEEKAHVTKARSKLEADETIVALPRQAKCTLTSAEVALPGQKHDHDHADEHQHEDHDSQEDTHLDITVTYRYECAQPKALDQMTLQAFSTFPGLERVEAVGFVGNKQHGAILTARNPRFTFD